ncbi:NfeD family protein [Methylicorpusculum oleiharenae]|uniref:NfeD family protein n=1 Tax=Methylicorpusculum oleiharenae TaxID=1338687 RepID=UPI0013583683|nr:NfeD family protein [Methylicorpusculum oleiharenae]MCD2449608.1 NfeD family protein [Methylicorpusculum oleiharenae]
MFEWLNAHIAYWHWIVLGFVLACGEILLPSFILLWFGLSAVVVGALLFFVPMPLSGQLLLWVILALINVWVWFKWISPSFKTKSLSGMAKESMIGQTGLVIECNGAHAGRGTLRFTIPILGNDEWQFICEDAVEPGSRVVVRDISGNTLIVSASKSNSNTV